MSDTFAQSRASLRSMLGVSSPGQDPEWRPQSKVMRAVLNPQNRAVVLAAASIATLIFPRLARAGALYPLVSKVARAGRHISKMRFRR